MSTNPNNIEPATTKILIKRLFIEHVRKHVSWLIIALSLMMVVAGTTAGLAFLMETILDDVFTAKSKQSLYFAASIVMSLFVAKGLATYGQTVIMSFVGQRILADLQKSMFSHLVNGDLSFFHNHYTFYKIAKGLLIWSIGEFLRDQLGMLNVQCRPTSRIPIGNHYIR